VILVSGGGSNLQAFIDGVGAGRLNLEIAAVLSDNPEAFGLERARRAGIPAECVARADYASRAEFERALLERIAARHPDLVLLAGFMRILGPEVVAAFEGRMLNIHPSLLPRHPGLHTHRRALEAGDREHGCTVHFVTDELDGGPLIGQARVPVLPGDTPETLAARVLVQEHRLYPWAASLVASGRVACRDGKAFLDGQPLTEPLQLDTATP
jgi:phosphoribosylglycinamide formyltransferase-1